METSDLIDLIDLIDHVQGVREAVHAAGANVMTPWLTIGGLDVHHGSSDPLLVTLTDIAVRMSIPPVTFVTDHRSGDDGCVTVTTYHQPVGLMAVVAVRYRAAADGLLWGPPQTLPVDAPEFGPIGRYWAILRFAAVLGSGSPWSEQLAADAFHEAGASVIHPGHGAQ